MCQLNDGMFGLPDNPEYVSDKTQSESKHPTKWWDELLSVFVDEECLESESK